MKGLPLAYNKDMQEDKEGVFDSVQTIQISLEILNEVIKTMSVNSDKMEEACAIGHLTATDLADYLVKNCNIAFREAHFITGEAVALAESKKIDISELSLDELQSVDKRIKEDVLEVLNLKNSMNSRNSYGGTSTEQTNKQIEYFKNWLEKVKSF